MIRVIFLLLLIFSGASQAQESLGPMRVGALLSLSGDAAVDGLAVQRGLRLAAQELASQGIRLQLEFEDDQTIPAQSLTLMRRMVRSKPDLIIGPIWSFLVDAAAPAIVANGICTYVPCATSEITHARAPNLLYGTAKNSLKAGPLAQWIKEHSVKRVAMLVSNDAWGESHESAFRAAAADANAIVAGTERLQLKMEGAVLQSLLLRLLQGKPDVVLWTGYDEGAQSLISAWHKLGLTLPIVGTEGLSRVVKSRAATLLPGERVFAISIPSSPKFIAKYTAEFGEAPRSYSESAYDALLLFGRAFAGRNEFSGPHNRFDLCHQPAYFDTNGDRHGGSWQINQVQSD